jgi:regulator of replication initiation timing
MFRASEIYAQQFQDRVKELEADTKVMQTLIEETGKENLKLEAENKLLRKDNKDTWIKACQAQNENISTGFNDNLDKLEDDPKGQSIFRHIAKSIKTYPLAEFNASTPPSEANKTE